MSEAKDIIERASKTFLQAFVSSFSVDTLFGVTDTETAKRILLSMLIASVAAGISAVWNMIQNYLINKIDESEVG